MQRASIKFRGRTYSSRKVAAARQAVGRASAILRGRTRAPLRTGGFYGLYTKRGRDELKTIDTGLITFASLDNANGNFQLLNGVDTGTDYTNRIGRKIIAKSLLLRFQWYPLSATTTDSNGDALRMIIFCDEQANGVAPIVTDILQTANYLAPLNLSNRGRFKIIKDKLISMPGWTNAAGALVNGNAVPKVGKVFKTMSLPVIFNGTGATVGSIQTNSMYILCLPASNATTGFTFNSRVRFIDS